jgi:hypothetical protein
MEPGHRDKMCVLRKLTCLSAASKLRHLNQVWRHNRASVQTVTPFVNVAVSGRCPSVYPEHCAETAVFWWSAAPESQCAHVTYLWPAVLVYWQRKSEPVLSAGRYVLWESGYPLRNVTWRNEELTRSCRSLERRPRKEHPRIGLHLSYVGSGYRVMTFR